jgi:hypothetical protein
MDLSASWKGLQKGGTCKQKRFFCHCCPLQSEHVHQPNDTKCDRYCSQRMNDDWHCYHHQVTGEQQLQEMKNEIEEIKSKLVAGFDRISKNSKLKIYPSTHRSLKSDRNSIDYAPSSASETGDFMDLLYEELDLCSLDMTRSMEDVRIHLKESLLHESKMRLLLDQVQHCECTGLALFLVMQAVPCILHCEKPSLHQNNNYDYFGRFI